MWGKLCIFESHFLELARRGLLRIVVKTKIGHDSPINNLLLRNDTYRCSLRVRTHSGSDVKSCLYQNTIHGGGGRVEQRIHPPRKRVAWKKLRKERMKFSKLLIFSTDCSQPMGLQSVIKIRGKTSKLFALHSSPFQ